MPSDDPPLEAKMIDTAIMGEEFVSAIPSPLTLGDLIAAAQERGVWGGGWKGAEIAQPRDLDEPLALRVTRWALDSKGNRYIDQSTPDQAAHEIVYLRWHDLSDVTPEWADDAPS